MVTRTLLSKRFLIPSVHLRRTMSMNSEQDVIFDDARGVITLNRPKALNALNLSMVQKLLPKLQEYEKSKKLVIVKGAGDKAFCAGGDVRAVTEAGLKGEKYGHDFFKVEYTVNGLIGTYKIPYIALIDGIVMGGGVGLSVHGRYRVATERSLFAMPETQIGLFPDVGGSYFLPRLEGKLGLYLALTGVRLKGADVLHAGIATHFVESKNLIDLENELVQSANNDNDVRQILTKFSAPKGEFSLKSSLNLINKAFSADSIEGILLNLESDKSKWAQDTLKLLNQMSPTSLKVTLQQLNYGARMNLLDCLQMEYRMAVNCLSNKDFYEGVRALLIDKDKTPRWSPDSVDKVTDQLVQSHFAKLPDDQELKHKL